MDANPSIMEQRVSKSSSFSRLCSMWCKISGTMACETKHQMLVNGMHEWMARHGPNNVRSAYQNKIWSSTSHNGLYLQKRFLIWTFTAHRNVKEFWKNERCGDTNLQKDRSSHVRSRSRHTHHAGLWFSSGTRILYRHAPAPWIWIAGVALKFRKMEKHTTWAGEMMQWF